MNIFSRCCSSYTRLPINTSMGFSCSCSIVVLCTYATVVTAYLSTAHTFAELQFLEYWLILSIFITGIINMPLLLCKNKNEVHEIVFELKMLHAMYFGNALVHYGLLNTSQSAISTALITNLVHCCALLLLFVELTVLLGHIFNVYYSYRYVKTCFVIILSMCTVVTIIVAGGAIDFLCNNLLMTSFLSVAYLLTAIVWATRKEAAGSNLQRIQIAPFNDPPPSFATVEMEDFLKEKINVV